MDSKKRNLILMILCIVGIVILLSIMIYNVVFAGSKNNTNNEEVVDNTKIEDDVDVEKEIDLNSITFDPNTYKLDEKLTKDGTFINKYAGLVKDGSNILDDINYRILYVNFSLVTGNKYQMAMADGIISSGYVLKTDYISEYNKYFGETYLYSKTVENNKDKIQKRFYNDCEDYPSVNNGRNVCFITNISEYPETYFLGLKIKETKKVRIFYGAYFQDLNKSGVYEKGYFKIVYKKVKYDAYLQSITFKKAA